MTAGIRIPVEDHVRMLASIGDQIPGAIFHILRHTENTSFDLATLNIFHTPGGPQVFHMCLKL
jgi:hypothetical protein